MMLHTNRFLFLLLIIIFLAPLATSQETATPSPLQRERIEWCDIWHTDADKTDRPRILLIGDSIVQGYFSQVEKELGDKVYCSRYTTSRSICDPVFFQELKLVLSEYHYSVIHFNHGLHGWGYTEDQYAQAFDHLLTALQGEGLNAKLIWATTTPVQPKSGMSKDQERVAKRNALAAERVSRQNISINDLYALSIDHPEFYSQDGVHFAPEGKTILSKAVAGAISKTLETLASTGVSSAK